MNLPAKSKNFLSYKTTLSRAHALIREIIFRGVKNFDSNDLLSLNEILMLSKKKGLRRIIPATQFISNIFRRPEELKKSIKLYHFLMQYALLVLELEKLLSNFSDGRADLFIHAYYKNREKQALRNFALIPLAQSPLFRYVAEPIKGNIFSMHNFAHFKHSFVPEKMLQVAKALCHDRKLKIVYSRLKPNKYTVEDYRKLCMNPQVWAKTVAKGWVLGENNIFHDSTRNAFIFFVKDFKTQQGISRFSLVDDFTMNMVGEMPLKGAKDFIITGTVQFQQENIILAPNFAISKMGFKNLQKHEPGFFEGNPFEEFEDILTNAVYNGISNCSAFLKEKISTFSKTSDFEEINKYLRKFSREKDIEESFQILCRFYYITTRLRYQWQWQQYFPGLRQ
ncbi:hypothetical protein ACFL35_18490 [Candidatus Riflebacteria bacterium]